MSVKCDIIKCRQPVVLPFAPAILRCTYVPPKPVAIRNRNSFSDPEGFFLFIHVLPRANNRSKWILSVLRHSKK